MAIQELLVVLEPFRAAIQSILSKSLSYYQFRKGLHARIAALHYAQPLGNSASGDDLRLALGTVRTSTFVVPYRSAGAASGGRATPPFRCPGFWRDVLHQHQRPVLDSRFPVYCGGLL